MKKNLILFTCMISGAAYATCPTGTVSLNVSGAHLAESCGDFHEIGTIPAYASLALTPIAAMSCSAGQYMDTTNTCVDCPSWTVGDTTVDSTSPSMNLLGISSCYVASGTTGTDASGSWSLVSDCNYE